MGQRFNAYVEQVLVPTLARGYIVVMDNLDGNKGAGACRSIEAPVRRRSF